MFPKYLCTYVTFVVILGILKSKILLLCVVSMMEKQVYGGNLPPHVYTMHAARGHPLNHSSTDLFDGTLTIGTGILSLPLAATGLRDW
jgi:hypothetical protein